MIRVEVWLDPKRRRYRPASRTGQDHEHERAHERRAVQHRGRLQREAGDHHALATGRSYSARRPIVLRPGRTEDRRRRGGLMRSKSECRRIAAMTGRSFVEEYWVVRIDPRPGGVMAWAGTTTRITLTRRLRKHFPAKSSAVLWVMKSGYRWASIVRVRVFEVRRVR